MKGDPKVIEYLNRALGNELVAINQYFLHSRMFKDWGLTALAEKEYEESIDEMKHADAIIERILFLEGVPNMQRLNPVQVGETVTEQFRLDLGVELEAIERFNRGVELAVAKTDNATRALLESMLVSEEEHTDWLETQLSLIESLGEAQYLAHHMH